MFWGFFSEFEHWAKVPDSRRGFMALHPEQRLVSSSGQVLALHSWLGNAVPFLTCFAEVSKMCPCIVILSFATPEYLWFWIFILLCLASPFVKWGYFFFTQGSVGQNTLRTGECSQTIIMVPCNCLQ